MAASRWNSTLYTSELYVEACGAIVFDTSTSSKKVCLLYHAGGDIWLLPKGRRNCGETRQATAVREVREESGYGIKLRPLTLATRAPSETEVADIVDKARVYDDVTEPFMLDVRDLGKEMGVKLVWWFIADVDRTVDVGEGEAQFKATFVKTDCAVERLTFQKDREVMKRAIEVMESQKN